MYHLVDVELFIDDSRRVVSTLSRKLQFEIGLVDLGRRCKEEKEVASMKGALKGKGKNHFHRRQ